MAPSLADLALVAWESVVAASKKLETSVLVAAESVVNCCASTVGGPKGAADSGSEA